MSPLPAGYRTTIAAELLTLWHDEPDGTSRCVTVMSDTCPEDRVAEIAARDARAHPNRTAPAILENRA